MKAFTTALMIALATAPGLLVLMAAPVNAQFRSMSNDKVSRDHGPGDQKEKKKTDDTGYKSALERLPDKKFDPWANMR